MAVIQEKVIKARRNAGQIILSKQKTMQNLTDYDHANMRRIGNIQHGFEAWTESETIIIDVAEFLEYCAQTKIIHEDSHISRHDAGLIQIPEKITGGFDAGRGEYFETEKTVSYSFAEFLADFSGNGLDEALNKFVNDKRTTARKTTSEVFKKHFGDVASVGIFHKNIEAFFEEINQDCINEDLNK